MRVLKGIDALHALMQLLLKYAMESSIELVVMVENCCCYLICGGGCPRTCTVRVMEKLPVVLVVPTGTYAYRCI